MSELLDNTLIIMVSVGIVVVGLLYALDHRNVTSDDLNLLRTDTINLFNIRDTRIENTDARVDNLYELERSDSVEVDSFENRLFILENKPLQTISYSGGWASCVGVKQLNNDSFKLNCEVK